MLTIETLLGYSSYIYGRYLWKSKYKSSDQNSEVLDVSGYYS